MSRRKPTPTQHQHASQLDRSQRELDLTQRENRSHYLARRIRELQGYDALEGTVDHAELERRLRAAIDTFGLSQVIVGRGADRKPITFGQALERTYGAAA